MATIKAKKRILAIIPARGGSKKLPGKNIKLMAGRPLIAYTIEAALKSGYIDRIIVSTDDEKISEVSKKYGAEVIKRPEHIATDNAKMTDVIFHALEILEKERYFPEVVILLQPTSPLRTTGDIEKATEFFLKNKDNCELVMSVCRIKSSAYWALKMEGNYLKPLFDYNYLADENQELSPIYIPNGAIYVSTPEIIRKHKTIHSSKILPYFMPGYKSIDIDDESDFKSAENFLLNNKIKI